MKEVSTLELRHARSHGRGPRLSLQRYPLIGRHQDACGHRRGADLIVEGETRAACEQGADEHRHADAVDTTQDAADHGFCRSDADERTAG